MKNRIISAIIMAVIILPVLYFGGIVFDIAVAAVAVLAFKELVDVKKVYTIPFIMKLVGIICMLALTYVNIDGYSLAFGLNYETLSLVFILLLAPTVLIKNREYSSSEAFYLFTITVFIGTVFNLFIMLYNESIYLFVHVILIACITDIFALLGGKLIGKNKLTKISPNKTIEGAIVGTVVSTIVATTYYVMIFEPSNIIKIVIINIILSVIGQIGDIFFSLIKRENEVKDYSHLIPGHGGIIDRLDSIMFILLAFVCMLRFL